MTSELFLTRLSSIAENDRKQLDQLAAEVLADARGAAEPFIQVWKREGDAPGKASKLLSSLEDVALVPMLDPNVSLDAEQITWLAKTVGNSLAGLQQPVIQWMTRLLSDTRIMPNPSFPDALEEAPPVVRVCDEAYLQLRRLLFAEEPVRSYQSKARLFLQLPKGEKNAEIRKAMHSRIWGRFDRP